MAFGAKRIFPIDTKPGTGVGVAIPFNAPGVFRTTYTTQEAIKNNLIDFFLMTTKVNNLNNQKRPEGFGRSEKPTKSGRGYRPPLKRKNFNYFTCDNCRDFLLA